MNHDESEWFSIVTVIVSFLFLDDRVNVVQIAPTPGEDRRPAFPLRTFVRLVDVIPINILLLIQHDDAGDMRGCLASKQVGCQHGENALAAANVDERNGSNGSGIVDCCMLASSSSATATFEPLNNRPRAIATFC
jgi:hypothetical protein